MLSRVKALTSNLLLGILGSSQNKSWRKNVVLPQVVRRPLKVIRSLGQDHAIANACRHSRDQELALANANLVMAQTKGVNFCALSLTWLKHEMEHGLICPWTVNQMIDLMYEGLSPQDCRTGIEALRECRGVKDRETVIRKLAKQAHPGSDPLHINAPAYLLHPAG